MAFNPQIQIGVATVLATNVVFALPARTVWIDCTTDVQVSNDSAFATSRLVTATTGGFTSAAFIRCPAGPATVTADAG
jgi:hypothetical protein